QQEKAYREWTGRPEPERIRPRGPEWARANLHAAANLLHLTERLDLPPGRWRAYKVAWLGACVLYDRAALVAAGGYDFWPRVRVGYRSRVQSSPHSGQWIVQEISGRCRARSTGAPLMRLPTQ